MYRTFRHAGLLWLVLFLLSGCASRDMSDLHQFVNEIKRAPGFVIDLPSYPYVEVALYSNNGPDPFTPFDAAQPVPGSAPPEVDPRPGCRSAKGYFRTAEELERYPLDALKLVGLLHEDETRQALVQDPTEFVHKVTYGNYIGQNNGRVVAVDEHGIEILEMVDDGTGCFLERQAALKLDTGNKTLTATAPPRRLKPVF